MTPYIVAIDHPSLVNLVAPFTDALRAESRRFGPSASANPKPFPSLIRKLADDHRQRLGLFDDGRLIAMASLSLDGELAMAVGPTRRNEGLGRVMMARLIDIAVEAGYGRLHMESSRRSKAVASLGAALGWTVVDMGRGRIELILDLQHRRAG